MKNKQTSTHYSLIEQQIQWAQYWMDLHTQTVRASLKATDRLLEQTDKMINPSTPAAQRYTGPGSIQWMRDKLDCNVGGYVQACGAMLDCAESMVDKAKNEELQK